MTWNRIKEIFLKTAIVFEITSGIMIKESSCIGSYITIMIIIYDSPQTSIIT